MRTRRYVKGFTLIELMIVVAVIGILVAIAYPSYRDSVLKGRRAQARAAILGLLQQQERYMTQNNQYRNFTNAAGTTNPNVNSIFTVFVGDSANGTPYWLSASTCDATQLINECVKVTATPTAADPAAGALSMTSAGAKSCSGTAPTLCWP